MKSPREPLDIALAVLTVMVVILTLAVGALIWKVVIQ